MLTELEKGRIQNYSDLKGHIRWKTSHSARKRALESVEDLIFLLENREAFGSIHESVGEGKVHTMLRLLANDMGLEQSVLSPAFVISIIEENRVLSEIISKKNKVWRDLVSKLNSARSMEDFLNSVLERDNVYFIEGDNVRVHLRRNHGHRSI